MKDSFTALFLALFVFSLQGCGDSSSPKASDSIGATDLTSDALQGEWILLSLNDVVVQENDSSILKVVSEIPNGNEICSVGRILARFEEQQARLINDGTSIGGCFASVLSGSNHLRIASALAEGVRILFEGDILVLQVSDNETYRFARLID